MMQNRVWKEIPNLKPENRCYHTSTLFQHYIITYGGNPPENQHKCFYDLKILNLKTGSLEEFTLKGDQPSQRKRHSACLFNLNQIIIFGGYDGKKLLHDTAIVSVEQTTRNNHSPLITLTLSFHFDIQKNHDNRWRGFRKM